MPMAAGEAGCAAKAETGGAEACPVRAVLHFQQAVTVSKLLAPHRGQVMRPELPANLEFLSGHLFLGF